MHPTSIMNRSFVAVGLAAFVGCSSARTVPLTRARPPTSAELSFNYQEAVTLSGDAANAAGYVTSDVRLLEQLRPNFWRIRFGVAPKGSGRLVDVYFDGTRREVVTTEEVIGESFRLSGPQTE